MNINTPLVKSLVFFFAVLCVIGSTFALSIFHHENSDNRLSFALTNQDNQSISQKELAGKHLLVFFGFTSCRDICPTQMSKLTTVMATLDKTGRGQKVTPIFISVDPERDSPEKISEYLTFFHSSFVGLTGNRHALKTTADNFKTFLQDAPKDSKTEYQVTHSSIIYVVDPFSRVVDYIPFESGHDAMVSKITEILKKS